MFHLSQTPINRDTFIAGLKNDSAGALVVFEGWVRNHNQGKQVQSLEYQVYETLAQSEGEKILHEARELYQLHEIACAHRFGHLHLGDIAVWIGATASHRDDAFKATRYVIDQIKLRLPIWKKEHYVNAEATWVFCRDHHHHVHFEPAEYYRKQEKLVEQSKLTEANVAIVGIGGLGCPVAMNLAAAGVGHLNLIDSDRVSLSNLHRQPLFAANEIGQKKAAVAKSRLLNLNPLIKITSKDLRVSANNVLDLVCGMDLVIDCTDNLDSKYLLHDACMIARVPLISASIFRYEGQLRTFIPGHSGCLRCSRELQPDDAKLGNCNDFGVVGAAVSALGSLQANEALQYLLNKSNATIRETLFFNFQNLTQFRVKNLKEDSCATCAGKIDLKPQDLEIDYADIGKMGGILVDIRGTDENFVTGLITQTAPVILYCDRGIRSQRVAKELRAKGYHNFYSLRGGSCSL